MAATTPPVPLPYPFLAAPLLPDEIGRLGPFRVLRRLGSGGMGIVFLAKHAETDGLAAVKVMRADLDDDPTIRQRFLREARALNQLRHDRIVRVLAVGEAGGLPYLAMEYLDGETLAAWSKRRVPATAEQIETVAVQVSAALAAMHERGFVHRDVKPSNLWNVGGGNELDLKLLDFGLVRTDSATWQTTAGAGFGTPGYVSPEQASGGDVDGRSDLFSLGCVLFELAAGRRPFGGADVLSQLHALAIEAPPDLRILRPDLPERIHRLIGWLLVKGPAKRMASARDVIAWIREEREPSRLDEAWDDTTATVPIGPPKARPSRRRTTMVATAGVGLGLAIAAWLLWLGIAPRADEVRDDPPGSAHVAKAPTPAPVDEWLTRTRKLRGEAKKEAVEAELRRLNPKLPEKLEWRMDGDKIVALLFQSNDLTDVSPLAALDDLERLEISGLRHHPAGQLSDLSPLRNLKLKNLDCSNAKVVDLRPLSKMPLEYLECSNCLLQDLDPLRGLPLRVLRIDRTKVNDLSPCRNLPLVHLSCDTTRVDNLTPLRGLPLGYLHFLGTAVKNVEPIRGLPLQDVAGPFQRPRHDELLRSFDGLKKINGLMRDDYFQ